MKQRIYLDNSATSFPKPDTVTAAMVDFAENCGASAGRGAYEEARQCGRILQICRERVAQLIHAEDPLRIVFALNCSEALAIAIRGLLNTAPAGTHAVATAMEHNSVLRPYNALAAQAGLEPQFVPCDPQTGLVDPEDIRRAIRPETALISCVHVSNVTGTLQPVGEVCRIAREAGIPVLIDAAQSVGHVPIDVQSWGADFVAFPGHKGCMGPLGTGVLYMRPGWEEKLLTMKEGGTGSISEQAHQPDFMPDKYEIGSHNAIGLAGLLAGIDWLLEQDVEALRQHDTALCQHFLDLTDPVEGLSVYGPREMSCRTGVFSVRIDGKDPVELANELERDYSVLTRPGIHCAPLAHKTIGTHPTGTTRMSFGPYTTTQHVEIAAGALVDIASRACPAR